MTRQISPPPEDLKEQGFEVVADSDTRLYHDVGGLCYKRENMYVPLGSVQEAEAHNYIRCNKCMKPSGAGRESNSS